MIVVGIGFEFEFTLIEDTTPETAVLPLKRSPPN